jgi:hypothetical protein
MSSHCTPRLLGALLVLAALAPWAAAGDVEVHLVNGDRLYGELVSDTPQTVTINRKIWTRNGQIGGKAELSRERVAQIEPVTSLEDLYTRHAAETGDTFDAQYTLARWCYERSLQDHAFVHAKRLYDRDHSDEITKQLLQEIGYVLDDDGTWLKEADYAQKHGMVVYEGKLMTPQQVELRKASAKADLDRDAAVSKSHALDGSAALADKRVKEAQDRVDRLKQDEQQEKQQQAQAKAKNAAANRARNRGPNQQQQQPAQQTQDDGSDEYADAIKQLEKQIADAQKGVDDAKKLADKAHQDAAAGKAAADQAQKKSDDAKQAFLDAIAKTPAGGAKPGSDTTAKATPDAAKPTADAGVKPAPDATKPTADAVKPKPAP